MIALSLLKLFAPLAVRLPRRPAGGRLQCEVLEDRLTPNNRFVVPLSVPADTVTTFHSLAEALSTPGLVAGDVVQVEQDSTPGAISNANVDAINATSVTVRGASEFGADELPVIRTADAISVDAEETGLSFENVNLQIDHTLTFNANGAIRRSNVVVAATGSDGIVINWTTATVLENNTIVNTGGSGNSGIRVSAVVGGANRIIGNRISNTALAYVSNAGRDTAIGDVVASNRFVSCGIRIDYSVNGLTIWQNIFWEGGVDVHGGVNVKIIENNFLLDNGHIAINIHKQTYNRSGFYSSAYTASATVIGNRISTGYSGTAISVDTGLVTIEANVFGENQVGVMFIAPESINTSWYDHPSIGIVNLAGGSPGSAGGNDFRSFTIPATATSGAIVVSNPGGGTIQAKYNLFSVADPETVIFDWQDSNQLRMDVVATGNLTGHAAFVQSLYVQYLKRAGDVTNPGGAGVWVDQLNAGVPAAVVANRILRSPEGIGKFGLTDSTPPPLTAIDDTVGVLFPSDVSTRTLVPFPGFLGGLTTASADLTGDGMADLVAGAGAGGGPHVRAFDGATGAELASFFAFDPSFRGGVSVAATNGRIVVGAGPGGGPHVKVIDAARMTEVKASGEIAEFALLANFFAFDLTFTGGVSVAAGDLNGDGVADVVLGAGPGGGAHVKVVDGTRLNEVRPDGVITDSALLANFFAFDLAFTGGVSVATMNGLIVVGAGPGGGPHVKVIDAANLGLVRADGVIADTALRANFFAFDVAFTGGVRVAYSDFDADGDLDLTAAAGPGGGPHLRAFNLSPFVEIASLFVGEVTDTRGVVV